MKNKKKILKVHDELGNVTNFKPQDSTPFFSWRNSRLKKAQSPPVSTIIAVRLTRILMIVLIRF